MGSFPFQFTAADAVKVAKDVLYVAVLAALTYVSQSVLPNLAPSNILGLTLLPVLAAGMSALIAYVKDTRAASEKARLSLDDYKTLPPEQRRIERLRVADHQ